MALSEQGVQIEEIYVLDMQKVINDSIAGKAARNNIEDEMKKGKAKIQKMQLSFENERKSFQQQAALLSGSAREEKMKAMKEKEQRLLKAMQEEQQELQKMNHRELGRVVEAIDEVVEDLAEEEGYEVIVEKDPRIVLYTSGDFDITDEVLRRLNAKKLDL